MKHNYLLSTVLLFLSFCACSNNNELNNQTPTEENESKIITSIDEMPDEIKSIIAETKTYISPRMQELITSLDTISTVHPIEEVLPFLFSEEPSIQTIKTKASSNIPTTTLTGYSNYETILNPITVSLTDYSSSALRQSLGYSDLFTMLGNGPYTVTFYAFTLHAYFSTTISNLIPLPSPNDFIGINPDKMPAVSNINNNTSLSLGFTASPILEGVLYQLTSYSLAFSPKGGTATLHFPVRGTVNSEPFIWGEKLEWTIFTN